MAGRSAIVVCGHCGKKNRVPAAAASVPRCGNCHRNLPWLADAGDDDFAEVVEQSPVPVIVDLWAPWCGPCRMVSPALESLARARAGEVKLVKVNVDDHPRTSARFEVRSIPMLLLMKNGEVVAEQIGALSEPALRAWLEASLPRDDRTVT
jgi:thioredoxin 2